MKPEFSLNIFEKNNKILNFVKLLAVGSELSHADRQTDMTELTVAFSSFTNETFTQITTSLHHQTSKLLQNLKVFSSSALRIVLTRHFQCITNLVSFASESKTEFFRMPCTRRCFVH